MKTRAAVLFGGHSVEHEVSSISGLRAFAALDRAKYDTVPLYIGKEVILEGAGLCSVRDFLYMIGMGLGVSVGQLFLNLAYRKAEASRLSPYSYVQNVYTLLISLFVFGQSISVYSYIGAALIIGANYLNLQAGRRASRKDAIQDGVQGHPGQKEPAHGAVR